MPFFALELGVDFFSRFSRRACSEARDGDLLYRINIFPVHIPPLREHKVDIRLLVEHFIVKPPAAGATVADSRINGVR